MRARECPKRGGAWHRDDLSIPHLVPSRSLPSNRAVPMTLALEGVSKKVGAATHIDDVHLSLERGSLNVLLGATLAGKTSLMRLMAGLDVPTTGRVLVDGRDVTGWPVQRRS